MHIDDVLIRRATKLDTVNLVKLYHDAYSENVRIGFPASAAYVKAEEVLDWITRDNVFVVEYERSLIGSVRLRYDFKFEKLLLCRLGILSRWKGRGIASKLMNYSEKEAIKNGYDRIILTTPLGHPYLPDMYKKRGYVPIGKLELPNLPYDEVIMEKKLDE